MKTILIIILSVVTQSLYSQSLINLYEDFIPQKLINNAVYKNSIIENLNYNANIHPDLIYYYIKYLISSSEHGISNPDSNYLNKLRYFRHKYLTERALWANIQIRRIEKTVDLRIKRNAMEKYYEELLDIPNFTPQDTINLRVDDNLLEFFNYLFFTKQKSVYDRSKNYYQINKTILEDSVILLNKEFNHFNINFNQKIEKIKKDIEYWYLIENPKSNKYGLSTNYQAFKVPVKTFKNVFLTKNSFILGFTLNGFQKPFIHIKNNIPLDKPLPTFINPILITRPISYNYYPFLSFGVGYQIALKPQLKLFSYLKIKFEYSLLISKLDDKNKNKDIYSFTYNVISGSEKQLYVYKSNGLKRNNSHFGFVKISMPIFYYSKELFLEFGLDFSARFLKYDYQVLKQSIREKDNQQTVESIEHINLTFKDSKLNFSPSLSIFFEIYDNINISLYNSVMWESYFLALSFEYIL